MTKQHPISPPPELVEQWVTEVWHEGTPARLSLSDMHIATEAARWGADQELEACCEVLARELICDGKHVATDLRNIRRPKPPSLKEQALALLGKKDAPVMLGTPEYRLSESEADTIRRALEQLDD